MFNLLTRLYACLLLVYPRPFRTVFREDMQAVFARQLGEIDTHQTCYLHRRWQVIGLLMKEIWDLPSTFFNALHFHSGSSETNATLAGVETPPAKMATSTKT